MSVARIGGKCVPVLLLPNTNLSKMFANFRSEKVDRIQASECPIGKSPVNLFLTSGPEAPSGCGVSKLLPQSSVALYSSGSSTLPSLS